MCIIERKGRGMRVFDASCMIIIEGKVIDC